jgi:hypothetical protein
LNDCLEKRTEIEFYFPDGLMTMTDWTTLVNYYFHNERSGPYYEACITENLEEAKKLFYQGHRVEKIIFDKTQCCCGLSGCGYTSIIFWLDEIVSSRFDSFTKMVDYVIYGIILRLQIPAIDWFLKLLPPSKLIYAKDWGWGNVFFATMLENVKPTPDNSKKTQIISRLLETSYSSEKNCQPFEKYSKYEKIRRRWYNNYALSLPSTKSFFDRSFIFLWT